MVHNPERVPEEALDALIGTLGYLGITVRHTTIGPHPIGSAIKSALLRSDVIVILGADRELLRAICEWYNLHTRPSRRAAGYITTACAKIGQPITGEVRELALMPAASTVLGPPSGLELGCGLVLEGRGLALLPPSPDEELISGDFASFINSLIPTAPPPAAVTENKVLQRKLNPAVTASGSAPPKAGASKTGSIISSATNTAGPLGFEGASSGVPNKAARLLKSRRAAFALTALLAVCLGVMAYTHVSPLFGGRVSAEPVIAHEPLSIKQHNYRYIQQDVYAALFPDSGMNQLEFLDAVAETDANVGGDVTAESAPPATSAPPVAVNTAPVTSEPPPAVSSSPVASEPPAESAPPAASELPPAVSEAPAESEPPPAESQEPDVTQYYEQNIPGEPDISPESTQSNLPAAGQWVDTLRVNVGGVVRTLNTFDLICAVAQVEMGGSLDAEAIKAQAVAAYTYIKYNNDRGLTPSVATNSNVSARTRSAVEDVRGRAVYYDGQYINSVYHSTSRGQTTSSRSVWGGSLPYLVPVDSPWDSASPYFSTRYTISADSLSQKVRSTYGIELSGDPSGWIVIDTSALADGGYVGRVYIGGYSTSQGGRVAAGTAITGRGVREILLGYALRSHSFDVTYDGSQFVFNTYGYGHGVGLSQYGAHFMARQGSSYVEILEHYYPGAVVR